MTGLNGDQCYRRHEDVAFEAAGDELLLVQLVHGTTFRLNRTGKAIWEIALQGQTAGEIAERLHRDLGVSSDELERDASALLKELAENALLERQPEAIR